MKYIDRVIKENADDESYITGVRLELSDLELYVIFETLKKEVEFNKNDNYLYERQKDLLNKFEKFFILKDNGYLRNIEID